MLSQCICNTSKANEKMDDWKFIIRTICYTNYFSHTRTNFSYKLYIISLNVMRSQYICNTSKAKDKMDDWKFIIRTECYTNYFSHTQKIFS